MSDGYGNVLMSVEPPARETIPSAVLPGVANGAGCALGAMGLYQLIRLGFWVAARTTVQAGATAPVGVQVDEFVGLELLPSLLSLGPTVVGGALMGGLVGLLVTLSWDRQSPVRAAMTGALATFVVAAILNLTLIVRHRRTVLTYDHWRIVAGYPSVIFILVFAAVGAWLYVSRARLAES